MRVSLHLHRLMSDEVYPKIAFDGVDSDWFSSMQVLEYRLNVAANNALGPDFNRAVPIGD